MNFGNFNPSMFNNIDHNQMKMASDMMAGMSDEQLRSYANMMGMPQMDPQMMRNNINMMKGMDSNQFENIKNTAKNFPPGGAYANPSTSSSQPSYQRQASAPATDSKQLTKYSQIESLKAKGNDYFKKEQYDQAGSAYFEAIIEIEELRSKNKKLQDDELDTLEISCRLNYSNVKAKEEDYDVVLSQAKKVLAIKENGKAYFRLGQAQFHLKKYEEALQNLNKAIPLLPGDTTVTTLRDKAQEVLQAKEGGSSSKAEKEEPKSNTQENDSKPAEEHREEPKEKEKPKSNLKKKNAPKVEDLPLPTINKPKEDRYTAPPESTIKEKHREEEVKIEEEKAQPPPPRQETSTSTSSYGSSGLGGYGGASGMTEEKFKQQQQQLGNMSPDQMKMMTDMFKGMDNATLKNMLKGQMGMDISDSQLESMKMMMTPEMLQNVSKMDMSQMPKNAFQGGAGGSTSTSSSRPAAQAAGACTHDHDHSEHGHHHHHAQPQAQAQGMPTMPPGMDFKLEQAQGMIDMMIQNPEMLKNMVGMIGEGNPIGKFVQNRSPQELAKYLKGLRACLKVYAKVSPLINFLKKYWQIVAGMMIAWAVIRIFNLA